MEGALLGFELVGFAEAAVGVAIVDQDFGVFLISVETLRLEQFLV